MTQQATGYPSIDRPWLKHYSPEAVHAPLPEGTIHEHLAENNRDCPKDIAILCRGRKVTYGGLFQAIDRKPRNTPGPEGGVFWTFAIKNAVLPTFNDKNGMKGLDFSVQNG